VSGPVVDFVKKVSVVLIDGGAGGYVATETITGVNAWGTYVVFPGIDVAAQGTFKGKVGDKVAVWHEPSGRPRLILNEATRKGFTPSFPVPGGGSIVEMFFFATNPKTGKRDVYFRNGDQVRPLGVSVDMTADMNSIALSPDGVYFCAFRASNIGAQFIAVWKLNRLADKSYAPSASVTAKFFGKVRLNDVGGTLTTLNLSFEAEGIPLVIAPIPCGFGTTIQYLSGNIHWPGPDGANGIVSCAPLAVSNVDVTGSLFVLYGVTLATTLTFSTIFSVVVARVTVSGVGALVRDAGIQVAHHIFVDPIAPTSQGVIPLVTKTATLARALVLTEWTKSGEAARELFTEGSLGSAVIVPLQPDNIDTLLVGPRRVVYGLRAAAQIFMADLKRGISANVGVDQDDWHLSRLRLLGRDYLYSIDEEVVDGKAKRPFMVQGWNHKSGAVTIDDTSSTFPPEDKAFGALDDLVAIPTAVKATADFASAEYQVVNDQSVLQAIRRFEKTE
jgi:hypothetical protein